MVQVTSEFELMLQQYSELALQSVQTSASTDRAACIQDKNFIKPYPRYRAPGDFTT
jgi:hypothetical protein